MGMTPLEYDAAKDAAYAHRIEDKLLVRNAVMLSHRMSNKETQAINSVKKALRELETKFNHYLFLDEYKAKPKFDWDSMGPGAEK
jgi:hypothetical protein